MNSTNSPSFPDQEAKSDVKLRRPQAKKGGTRGPVIPIAQTRVSRSTERQNSKSTKARIIEVLKARTQPLQKNTVDNFGDVFQADEPTRVRNFDEPTRVIDQDIYARSIGDDQQTAELTKVVDAGLYSGIAKKDFEETTKVYDAPVTKTSQGPIVDKMEDGKTPTWSINTSGHSAQQTAISSLPLFPQDEISVHVEYSLEDFLQKEQLEKDDAYILYEFLQQDLNNKDLWDFILRVAPKTADALILKHNLNLLSPALIQALLVVGSAEKQVRTEEGKVETLYIATVGQLGQGSTGVVSHAFYAHPNNWQMHKCLLKTPLKPHGGSGAAFHDEVEMARHIQKLVQRNKTDSRAKHILSPTYVGDDFIVMRPITNRRDQHESLLDLFENKNTHPSTIARLLAEAMEGNSFLSEHGVINVDFKPGNVLVNKKLQAMLIDWGGLVDKKVFHEQGGYIAGDQERRNAYPVTRGHYSKYLKKAAKLEEEGGGIPFTPAYNSSHLIAMELDGRMPAGSTHKFLLARTLDRYLQGKYGRSEPAEDTSNSGNIKFRDMNELDKLFADPWLADGKNLSPADLDLYKLYRLLHTAHFHPYLFKEGDPANGVDESYISNPDIVKELRRIAAHHQPS